MSNLIIRLEHCNLGSSPFVIKLSRLAFDPLFSHFVETFSNKGNKGAGNKWLIFVQGYFIWKKSEFFSLSLAHDLNQSVLCLDRLSLFDVASLCRLEVGPGWARAQRPGPKIWLPLWQRKKDELTLPKILTLGSHPKTPPLCFIAVGISLIPSLGLDPGPNWKSPCLV